MTNWKSMFFRLVELARTEKTVNDEAEIIGWATHEDGQHYPIHAAQGGGGGSAGASSGGGSKISGGSGADEVQHYTSVNYTGSEKQQKWAKDIVKRHIDTLDRTWLNRAKNPKAAEMIRTEFAQKFKSAGDWIDWDRRFVMHPQSEIQKAVERLGGWEKINKKTGFRPPS